MRWFLQKAPPAIIPGSAAPAGSDGSTSHESDGIENSFESVNRRKAALHLKGGGQLGFFSMDLFPLDVVCTETYLKVLVFDDNRNSLYANYLYYLYYHRFLLSKPAVTIFLTAKSS